MSGGWRGSGRSVVLASWRRRAGGGGSVLWRTGARVAKTNHERVGRWSAFRVRVLAVEMLLDNLVEGDESSCVRASVR